MNIQERAGSIAQDILALARNSLVVNFRFLAGLYRVWSSLPTRT